MENTKIKLWVFYYNPMIYESAAIKVSYHKTKKGATDAMKAHKLEERKQFDKMYKNETGWKPKFGSFESWFVDKFELEIFP